MSAKPWYKIAEPREDLRDGRPLDASEFAVHLDKVREGTVQNDSFVGMESDSIVGRGEALRRFLVNEGIDRDHRFWRLAQALSAMHPVGADEKRWVDGVLARKKGLGF